MSSFKFIQVFTLLVLSLSFVGCSTSSEVEDDERVVVNPLDTLIYAPHLPQLNLQLEDADSLAVRFDHLKELVGYQPCEGIEEFVSWNSPSRKNLKVLVTYSRGSCLEIIEDDRFSIFVISDTLVIARGKWIHPSELFPEYESYFSGYSMDETMVFIDWSVGVSIEAIDATVEQIIECYTQFIEGKKLQLHPFRLSLKLSEFPIWLNAPMDG